MTLAGQPYRPHGPADGTAAGIGLIPEDRKEQSLVLFAPIAANVTVGILRRIASRGLLSPGRQRAEGRKIAEGVRVRMQSVDQPAGSLSGGNQQRVVFGRAFATKPRLLLLDEPTRGVDVGAKAEIYELIDQAAADGMAVLVASSELEELQLICHRIAVLRRGLVTAVLSGDDATKERIMTAAAGTGDSQVAANSPSNSNPVTVPNGAGQ
jgi:ribose transport system ATP-binding protein